MSSQQQPDQPLPQLAVLKDNPIMTAINETSTVPWLGFKCPKGYILNSHGVFREKQDSEVTVSNDWLSRPLWVIAQAHDESGSNWGLVLQWLDNKNRLHDRPIGRQWLHGRSKE